VVDAWAKYDRFVDLAEQYDIEIIARLSNPPSWTRALTDTIGSMAPPDNFADYGDFVAATAVRYQGRVRAYQLWNEPNGNRRMGLAKRGP
jgi:polysaccharide biosynthesis protein PslG